MCQCHVDFSFLYLSRNNISSLPYRTLFDSCLNIRNNQLTATYTDQLELQPVFEITAGNLLARIMIQITNVYKKHEFLLALRIPLALGEMAGPAGQQ